MTLPAELVNEALPSVSCYISDDRVTWLLVDQIPATATGSACGMTGVGTDTPALVVINVPVGDYFQLVAVF